jgi:hypothetical protein
MRQVRRLKNFAICEQQFAYMTCAYRAKMRSTGTKQPRLAVQHATAAAMLHNI